MSSGRRPNNMGLMLLGTQVMNYGVKNIPPVTLALMAGQTAIFLDFFPQHFPSPMSVCVSSYLVYYHKDWMRMIKSTFVHGDDMHLYFNMLSLLYKGTLLEKYFGSLYFAYLIAVFSAVTSSTYVGIGLLLGHIQQSYLMSCAVGFSGVLFALKVLVTHYSPASVKVIYGIPFNTKYVYWVELVLIQMAAPNASFVGHLAGILVGLAYVKGPLKFLMDIFYPFGIQTNRHFSSDTGSSRHQQRQRFQFSGRTGYRPSTQARSQPRPFFTGTPTEGLSFPDGPTSPPPQRSYNNDTGSSSRSAPHPSTARQPYTATAQSAPYSTHQRTTPSAPPLDTNQHNSVDPAVYTGGLDEDEQLSLAINESLKQSFNPSSSYSYQAMRPNLSELRSKRAKFYQ
ncbi:rhomboid-related protein 4-like isoform X1 [Physella acuta]|uniref:rhomboid-related protein 4-like isoform X1 n=1 Tax=Physella acuta TaxID=109671 RepID=UPI0027DD2FF3|nr:rhomboid-related protein 4-like isoform X1 [Physella acuta]XP_059145465.1 rhomboid-related protein 4-like isoform X1 [Physella acuta]XP_059145467.1 rhomboid-related protein 4-like isoform X1 [Physella acuta]XP_059145468.1 rhomboid-related protein 4-like isoform X1 [Physella acuta]XP_059145469.1 rhomboid-related protein 4-like isoform X1 [Physella acuta]